jgi:hypothetical protein
MRTFTNGQGLYSHAFNYSERLTIIGRSFNGSLIVQDRYGRRGYAY